ncbi:hypothetical protein [Eubacterium oxidoreducens]|uniref:Tannase and feruloyl esterase n=1 Tax=Eubacterium oxidoreducens TaxID=1732 RepID=A0A1G6AFB0_EUBOX|nr:hypothetical protein [Eubacterium oxidoreducens]SDB07104.1 hypothetical protein SAMN02910417_00517 [Eubacterium oxidoreducens]
MKRKAISITLVAMMIASLSACSSTESDSSSSDSTADLSATSQEDIEYIEETLNLANNEGQEWTYSSDADAWTLSIVSAVAYPEIEDEQGVSVCVPGAYVKGIDSDGDGTEDVTAEDAGSDAVQGSLIIDYDAEVTSTNGQTYTAETAPVILNTGAAGYSSSTNTEAATTYAAEGYINVACGNRGKQDTTEDEDGNTTYTGDAPSCLVDQKNAARYVKYNILLGNLPGSVDYFVSTGGSGGGAHATMFAATSNNSDYYDYEIEAGAVGVYRNEDGSYSTTVSIDGTDYELSDGAWGCVAYSAITSLSEADMAMAFEYYMDTDYEFGSSFQSQLAEYLSEEYMEYINEQNLSVTEESVGFDLNDDGDTEDTIDLSIEYDEDKYADTNGYGGSYLDLYMAEFQENLQWYLDNLDYADGWTWFDEDGNALSDEEVAAMTSEDKATAFIEGRYAKSTSSSEGGMEGGMPGGGGKDGAPTGEAPTGEAPTDGEKPTADATTEGDSSSTEERSFDNSDVAENSAGDTMDVGTPDAGTTQSAGSSTDSSNYSSYEEMLEAYESDIASIEEGDEYGNNIVELYNPLNYIGNEDTENPTWMRIVMGASEGDMSMFSSLNLQIAAVNAGIDATIEWQWDGGHVPSEVLGESLALYVDEMYGEYVEGATTVTKSEATKQTENGDAEEATGTDISSWVSYDSENGVSFSLADAVSYRTAGASKTIPGFDVIDYGQEDYVFGDSDSDARHWDSYLLGILQEHADELSELFNADSESTEE